MSVLTYLQGYPPTLLEQAQRLVDQRRLGDYLLKRYPEPHQIRSSKALYGYVQAMKNRCLRQSAPVTKVEYDDRLQAVKDALGLHSVVSRVQGGKLKAKQEIRIAGVFRTGPEPFLSMIVAHELAHLREKEHNKAFYKLCIHMEPDYHQLELDLRLYLTWLEVAGPVYT